MRALMAYKMSRSVPAAIVGAWVAVGVAAPTCANVITDWDEKAVAVVMPVGRVGQPTDRFCSICSACTPAFWSAHLMAVAPRRGAAMDERVPRNEPIGVRAAPTMTISFMESPNDKIAGRILPV